MPKLVPHIPDGDWVALRRALNKLASVKLGPDALVTHAGLTLTDLTASRLIASDANKGLVSSDLYSWVTQTANQVLIADDGDGTITFSTPQDIHTGASPTFTGLTLSGLTATRLMATGGSKEAASVADLTSWIAGTTDHISVADDSDGTVTLNLDTNTQTLLGSFNGIFLEKLDFTISEAGGTITGSLEQDSGGDLIQRFSDGYTTLDCTPALTINLTGYVGSDAVPKEVFVYILQSAKTVMAASNSDWPSTEHCKIAHLVLKSAATTGTDGGALVNQNVNDFASAANGEGHISHVEERIRKEPARWDSGTALTLKNSAGAALNTSSSSTAVEIVIATGQVYQLHRHTFPAFDMYTTATDDAHIVNQPTDEGGAYETTADLVSDITHYVDGTAAGVAIGTNKYFNLVIWGIQNRGGEASHVMINLPTGQYTTEAAAISDTNGTSVFDISDAFEGTGFLIARLTFRLIAGPQWTYIAQEDLRGKSAPISAGVSVSTTAHDLLSNLDFASAAHTGFQAQGDVLDDLNTLGAVGANSEFLVGTGAGALAWENAATAATSMGLGTGDSPTFAAVSLGTGELTCGSINRASGTLTLEIGGTAEVSITTTTVTLGGNLIIPDSGTIGSVSDTDVMTIDSSGNTTFSVFPITPSAAPDADYEVANKKYVDDNVGGAGTLSSRSSVYLNTTQAITTGTWTKVELNTEDYDNDGEFDNATNYRFQPDTTGYYNINAAVQIDSLANAAVMYVAIYKNGSLWKAAGVAQGEASTSVMPLGCDMYLLDSDYIELWVYHTHGSNRNVGNVANRQTFMDVHSFAAGGFSSRVRVSLTSTQSVPSGSYTKLALATEQWDNDGEFASNRFTAIAAGYYHVSYHVQCQALAADKLLVGKIYKNGAAYSGADFNTSNPSGQTKGVTGSDDVYLDGSTDYIEIFVYHDHGSNRDFPNGTDKNYVAIHRFA